MRITDKEHAGLWIPIEENTDRHRRTLTDVKEEHFHVFTQQNWQFAT